VLATLVQSRTATHLATLAQQVKPSSLAAWGIMSQRALNLAVQDAFWLTLIAFLLALLVVCFIRVPASIEQPPVKAAEPTVPEGAVEASRISFSPTTLT
jgi:hypothetical protein